MSQRQRGGGQQGPGKSPTSSQSGQGSKPGSKAGSVSGAQGNWPTPLGYDPAKPAGKTLNVANIPRNLEVPPEAYHESDKDTTYPRRPGYNASGENAGVIVNQFRFTKLPQGDVYQYRVDLDPTPLKSGFIRKVWEQPWVKEQLAKRYRGNFIYDGEHLAWTANACPEVRLMVDMGELQGRKPRKDGKKDTVYLIIKPSVKIRLAVLGSYLQGKMSWDNSILEAMNFLDHLIREGPSKHMKAQKRNFFHPQAKRHEVAKGCIEAIKGIYASIRMSESIASGAMGLGINVDTANCAFFVAQDFEQLVLTFFQNYDRKWRGVKYIDLAKQLAPVEEKLPNGAVIYKISDAMRTLRKLKKLKVTSRFEKNIKNPEVMVVQEFLFRAQSGGANAKNTMFEKKNPDGTTQRISVFDHFKQAHNLVLRWPELPLVDMGKKGYWPMEGLKLERYNRYPYKLGPNETSEMIKFAVTRPKGRWDDISDCVQKLGWGQDPYLQEFGVTVNPQPPKVPAKVIKPPKVEFAKGETVNPLYSGRWDLRGKRFVKPNKVPLRSWAFVVVGNCLDKATVDNFAAEFKRIYKGHGGLIDADPQVLGFTSQVQHNEMVEKAYLATGNKAKASPQIIFFILPDKASWVYERLKKNTDCRWAVPSQMLLSQNVVKNQPQYHSNVCMKVNAKLGGQTSRNQGVGPQSNRSPFFKVPTMMIGCDVSHAAPGSESPSQAALTVSMDSDAAVYHASVQTNGSHLEVLTRDNVHEMLSPHLQKWKELNGVVPKHVFYMRDGVSEGEFAKVMQQEHTEIQQCFWDILKAKPAITVIVATKRHHVRFFPEKGDRNGNALPGTVVEREVTHPYLYDFYLCSHVAIQGTARPVHYYVLLDEVGMKVDDLQRMLYHQCYIYARATTPVSLHPAIYYAHLAGARARAHENQASSQQAPPSAKMEMIQSSIGPMAKIESGTSRSSVQGPPVKLLPLGGAEARADMIKVFRHTMWYI